MTVDDYIDFLDKTQVHTAADLAIKEFEADILLQIRSQMLSGERGDGSSFKDEQIPNGVPGGYGHWDDLWEAGGAKHFQTELFISSEIDVWSSDWKTPYIFSDLGERLFWVNVEDKGYIAFLQPKIYEQFMKIIKQ